ncbi:MAG: hypothetical protein QOF76_1148 [Solirubrobacteraceae bacterium]|jgi:hypothetical protein|nr:hypothetical protein [Solirubrobacteraceae bacterium]
MDRTRLIMLATGAAPLAAGTVLPVDAVMDGPVVCPWRTVTGLPCPLCGATRAFVLFGHGDGRWVDYGAVWVLAAIALVAVAVLGLRRPRGSVAATFGAGWAWALAHAAVIT